MLSLNKHPLAEEDLIAIWIYGCETWSANQADHYFELLEAKINSLREFAGRYPLRSQFNPPIRICPHLSHIIIYTIDADTVTIIRVLHKTMNVEQRL
ncbi:MAG: plasmid stabilization protein ParE [Alteromonadaceae bacterium]|nr:MAG: plasmid stabilization protein ParE [Alteromonadaceae bacterium]